MAQYNTNYVPLRRVIDVVDVLGTVKRAWGTMATRDSRGSSSRRQMPPYSSFIAFEALLRRAGAEGLPLQIDKALLIDWGIAAGNESGLLTTLKALGIVDEDGRPTELYREIRLSLPRRTAALRRAAELAYPGLTTAGDSPDEDQLHDYFVEQRGLTGQMVDKAIRFYRQLSDAVRRPAGSAEPEAPKRAVSPIRPTQSQQPDPTTITRIARSPAAYNVLSLPPLREETGNVQNDVELQVVVQVTLTTTEDELTDLFRKVRRAWNRSLSPDEV